MPPTQATTAAESIRQQLADDILHAVYPPGARLDEKTLAERFGLSRTPVREALRQLTSAGLVDMRPHRGAIVSLPSKQTLAEMFEVMAEMESACARLAAQRVTPAERSHLEFIHRRGAEAVRTNDRANYKQINFEFHDAIYRGAHNDFLLASTISIRQRLAGFRRAQFEVADRLIKSYSEHDMILRAILRGDMETAGKVSRAHVNVVWEASDGYVDGLPGRGGNAA
jgi:DNA-binding GntR family transcriptional regulator